MKKPSMSLGDALFLWIAGCVLGTVFTFGMQFWNAPVTPGEAIDTTAIFSSFREKKENGHVQEIILRFEDHDQLSIAGVCIDPSLERKVDSLTPGTPVAMLVHPNSNTILQLRTGTMELLDFEESVSKLSSEAKGFTYLGVFCYLLSATGFVSFVRIKHKSGKHRPVRKLK